MSELQPVNCGCGGEAIIAPYHGDGYESFYVYCQNCNIGSDYYETEAEAVEAWNRAMGNRMELQTVERTAKVDFDAVFPVKVCGKCHNTVDYPDVYCSHCGAKLEWE